jgi:hypothetical protein
MSRPSVVEQKYDPRRNGVIDFVNTPLPPQAVYPSPVACGYDDPYAHHQYAYSMVGGQYVPMAPTPTYVMPAPNHPQLGSLAAGYPPHQQFVSAPVPFHAPEQPLAVGAPSSVSTAPRISEEDLDQKINTQINSIMAAQKAEMLCSKVESLTHKIQKMSHSMEMAKMANSSSNSYDDDAPRSSGRVSSDYESAIGNSLRRLAEESNTSDRRRSASQGRKPRF